MSEPSRPALRWHGGKWLLAPWIISNLPPHRVYVEPFGGAASVLIRKPRSYAEVYNDLDNDVVNLFTVLRGPRAMELRDALRLTPFAREEFRAAYEPTGDAIEKARRLIIRSFMGFGSDGHNGARMTGFRASSNRSGTTPAHDWVNYPDALTDIVARLSGVVIEHRPAIEVMLRQDGLQTLHYVDPPYVHSTRSKAKNSSRKNYTHEMADSDHAALLEVLRSLSGMVVLSGYPHPLYDDALPGWRRIEREALADGARKRTEVLWINPQACAAIDRVTIPLFATEAA
jgi:DNA adenine methylase